MKKKKSGWCKRCGKYKKMPARYGKFCWDCLPKMSKNKILNLEKKTGIIYEK